MSVKKYGLILFFAILLFHCFAIAMGWSELRFYSKLMLVPVLMILLGYFKGISFQKQSWLPWLGLVGAFVGDWLLALPGEMYFLLGMLGFMATHVSNSLYFLKLQPLKLERLQPALLAFTILIITCSFVIFQIKDQLGPMLFPIMVYMGLISWMTILAANLAAYKTLKSIALKYFIPGASCFVLSDAFLALNKFLWHRHDLDILVMITYGLAILLLTQGVIHTEWQTKKIPSKSSRG